MASKPENRKILDMISADPMMICQVMLSAGFGGAERLFVDLCRALSDSGHQVAAVCHPNFKGLPLLIDRCIRIFTLEVHLDWNPFARVRFKKMMEHFKPQVIHSHLARSASIVGNTGRKLSIPVAANLHNYVKLKYYRQVDLFFPGTEDQRKYLVENGIASDRILMVPHFTMLPARDRIEKPAGGPTTFVSYGRFVRKKGFHILLQAFKQLKERGIRAKLLLGGDGPEKGSLLNLIDGLELQQDVILPGWVDDIVEFLSRGTVFVLPSLDEPFGIVVLEAMSQGKVILSTATKGPQEILNSASAYFCPPGDASAMSNAMEQIWREGEMSRLKAQKALEAFKARYSTRMVLPVFESAYRKMIRQGKND